MSMRMRKAGRKRRKTKNKAEENKYPEKVVWRCIVLSGEIRYNFHIENSMIKSAAYPAGYVAAFRREQRDEF